MASNKHHELTKLAMNQLADSLPDFTIRQDNKFVNVQNEFPLLIKFDYAGKWRLKGITHLYVAAGAEIAADYTYFNTERTWVGTKKKFYITNFMCSRIGLIPQATEWYVLEKEADNSVGVELLTRELTDYFLPYLDQLTSLEGMVGLLIRDKPTGAELLNPPLYGRNYAYDWLAVIYLLLKSQRKKEAGNCIDEFIAIIDAANLPDYYVQEAVNALNRLRLDFEINRQYGYNVLTNTIITELTGRHKQG